MSEPDPCRDPNLACAACGLVLGYLDVETSFFRMKTPAGPVFVRLGTGGAMIVPCARCGATESVEFGDAPPAEAAATPGQPAGRSPGQTA